jgi:hypothetical protein
MQISKICSKCFESFIFALTKMIVFMTKNVIYQHNHISIVHVFICFFLSTQFSYRKKIETLQWRFFCNFDPKLKIWIAEKKWASIFSKVDSKESWRNTEEKVGLRQPDILKFQWSNWHKRIFEHNIDKNEKNFEEHFVVIWVVLCVQNINNSFGAFLWRNNCSKCRNLNTL